MRLSIIIPVYNAATYIEKCIKSCENQGIPQDEYEIIVVDDGSTDETRDIVLQLQREFSNISYRYQENARQGAARNNGLRNAKGDYIWYVDADDWIEECCIGEILFRMERDSLTALATRHAKYYKGKIVLWSALDETRIKAGWEVLTEKDGLVSPTYCVWERGYLVDNNLFFLEHVFHEDSEIYPKMFYAAKRVGFYNKVCYYIYDSENSTTRSCNPKRAHDIITVVESLQEFCDKISSHTIRRAVRQYICTVINASFFNTFQMSDEEIGKLNQHWALNKQLFNNLIKSCVMKYMVEGFLFKLFPQHTVRIYKLMQKGNPNPGNMKMLT